MYFRHSPFKGKFLMLFIVVLHPQSERQIILISKLFARNGSQREFAMSWHFPRKISLIIQLEESQLASATYAASTIGLPFWRDGIVNLRLKGTHLRHPFNQRTLMEPYAISSFTVSHHHLETQYTFPITINTHYLISIISTTSTHQANPINSRL